MKLYESTSRNYKSLRNAIQNLNPICISHANNLFDKLSNLALNFKLVKKS